LKKITVAKGSRMSVLAPDKIFDAVPALAPSQSTKGKKKRYKHVHK
jgi:hypothetical protein